MILYILPEEIQQIIWKNYFNYVLNDICKFKTLKKCIRKEIKLYKSNYTQTMHNISRKNLIYYPEYYNHTSMINNICNKHINTIFNTSIIDTPIKIHNLCRKVSPYTIFFGPNATKYTRSIYAGRITQSTMGTYVLSDIELQKMPLNKLKSLCIENGVDENNNWEKCQCIKYLLTL